MAHSSLPVWLQRPSGAAIQSREVKRLLRRLELHTVCEEARCPNIVECFAARTATFLLLGDTCTRNCRFCSVRSGTPDCVEEDFREQAVRVCQAAEELNLAHVVLTSVTRDDLEDGGASGFVVAIEALRAVSFPPTVEILVPDFCGNQEAIEAVLKAEPDVFNHNLDTVPRLYSAVRPQANYQRSLDVLRYAREVAPGTRVKTGVMLGMGESREELGNLMQDAREHGVRMFTAGQYLQPTRAHLPVCRYLSPHEFEEIEAEARGLGFESVHVGPLIRSSYHAEAKLDSENCHG